MQCVDVKSEKSSQCRIRLFNVRLISTHRLFIHDIHVSMTLFSFFSFRPGDLLLSPLQQAVEVPSPTRGAMRSAEESLSSSLPGLGESMYNLRIFIKRTVHSLSVTVPCQSWGFHRCFCFNYLGDRENEGVSSNSRNSQWSTARFCSCRLPMKTLVAATRRFPAWRHFWNQGLPKVNKTEKGSYSLWKMAAVLVQTGLFSRVPVFSCLVGRLTFTSHGPHISMERFWQIIVVAACNSDWRHGPFWYSTGGLQRQDVRQLSGLNLGPGNPNTRQIKHDKKQLSRCFNWF